MNASVSSRLAPVNLLRMSEPRSGRWHQTYSLATRFIPSWSEVTMQTSPSW